MPGALIAPGWRSPRSSCASAALHVLDLSAMSLGLLLRPEGPVGRLEIFVGLVLLMLALLTLGIVLTTVFARVT